LFSAFLTGLVHFLAPTIQFLYDKWRRVAEFVWPDALFQGAITLDGNKENGVDII